MLLPFPAGGRGETTLIDRITAMANVTAQMVKELRDKTGAGMMDCKAALSETNADMEAAVDWLRKKGLSKAAKKAGRIAAEALDVGPDVEAIKAGKVGDRTINDAINSAIATIGENMSLRRAAQVSVEAGAVGNYVHNWVSEGLGKIGVIVALESPGQKDELLALGRLIAQHIAASKPQAVDPSGLDPQLVAREKDILADKFRAQGKPEAMIAKIVESGLKTFYKEVCLLDQPYIREPDKSVAQAIKEAEGKVGGAIKVTGFVCYSLGEGIDRPGNDFGGEVAAMAGKR